LLSPSVESWRPYVAKLTPALGNIPVPFVLAWIEVESAGNPCAVGFVGDIDAQGQVLESGLFQLMSPHDIATGRTTVAAMRENCSTQTHYPEITPAVKKAYHEAAAKIARHESLSADQTQAWGLVNSAGAAEQKIVRPLTEDQKVRQIMVGLQYIFNVTRKIDAALAAVGTTWSKTDPGYWALVKSYHAAAGFPTGGLAIATKALGHAPANWTELVHGVRAASGAQYDGTIANATKTMLKAFPQRPNV
jgi:hypothetical protein